MARWNDLPWRDEVYAAAEIWKERCLLEDNALFSKDSTWTHGNLKKLQELIIFNADWGASSFWDKLSRQLINANPKTVQLAAELMWLIFLFPLGQQVGDVKPSNKASTKLKKIGEILAWAHLPPPTGEVVTTNALSGVGRTGRFYRRYFHAIRYMLEVLIALKQLPMQRRVELLEPKNAWDFANWNDSFEQETQVPLRHALLFFLFPDSFERMVSFNHKKEVVRDYWHKLSMERQSEFFAGGGFQAPLAIDKAIFLIRKDLEKEHGTTELDFYHGALDKTWGMENKPFQSRPQAIDPPTRSAGHIATPDGGDNNRFENLEEGGVDSRKMSEGKQKLLQHYRRERRPQLRDLKLKSVEKDVGFLQCECCGTAAEAYPPEYRRSVFEVHHKRPLSEGSTMTGVDDLALLCANCHRAIHVDAEMPPVDVFRRRMP